MAKKKITFESGIQELETLIRALEQGQMPLEESFKAFEKAIELKNTLQEMLDEGEINCPKCGELLELDLQIDDPPAEETVTE